MDIVKRERNKITFNNGNRVSVPGAYFGDEGTFYGTVIHVSTTHIQVKWDMDDQFSKVDPKDLTLEAPDLPFQKVQPSPIVFI